MPPRELFRAAGAGTPMTRANRMKSQPESNWTFTPSTCVLLCCSNERVTRWRARLHCHRAGIITHSSVFFFTAADFYNSDTNTSDLCVSKKPSKTRQKSQIQRFKKKEPFFVELFSLIDSACVYLESVPLPDRKSCTFLDWPSTSERHVAGGLRRVWSIKPEGE